MIGLHSDWSSQPLPKKFIFSPNSPPCSATRSQTPIAAPLLRVNELDPNLPGVVVVLLLVIELIVLVVLLSGDVVDVSCLYCPSCYLQ